MACVCLVSCVSRKQNGPVPAAELYISDWFQKARAYAMANADRWIILSAEHGVLAPTDEVCRYEKTLIGMKAADRRAWAEKVISDLLKRLEPGDEVTFLAGENYREFLAPALRAAGFIVRIPMEGFRIGEQLNWLENSHAQHVERFYELLDDLAHKTGGPRQLGKCCGRDEWPRRGIYFFFEPGEMRRSKPTRQRVVRVGTHAIRKGEQSTLWKRLRGHRGSVRTGGGNHRGSIYRLHSGVAIMAREGLTHPTTWSVKKVLGDARLSERDMECRVSDYLATAMLLWLDVDDAPGPNSDRATIERHAIRMLTKPGAIIDPPSPEWLGRYSARQSIRDSGLWNVDHVGKPYDPAFLDVMEKRVRAMLSDPFSDQKFR